MLFSLSLFVIVFRKIAAAYVSATGSALTIALGLKHYLSLVSHIFNDNTQFLISLSIEHSVSNV